VIRCPSPTARQAPPPRSFLASRGWHVNGTASTPAEPRQSRSRRRSANWRPGYDNGIQCRADPRCEVPAPPETGICHCNAKQATKAGAAIHELSRVGKVRRARSREPEKELEP
jgi:hypothetical protein